MNDQTSKLNKYVNFTHLHVRSYVSLPECRLYTYGTICPCDQWLWLRSNRMHETTKTKSIKIIIEFHNATRIKSIPLFVVHLWLVVNAIIILLGAFSAGFRTVVPDFVVQIPSPSIVKRARFKRLVYRKTFTRASLTVRRGDSHTR